MRWLVIVAIVITFPAMALPDDASVEFHLPATDALGRMGLDGKIRFADGNLYVHWKVRDRTFTRAQNKLQTAKLGAGDIGDCELEKGWFSTTLRVEAKDPRLLEDMPGVDMGRIAIKLDRSQRKEAEKLVSLVDYEVSQWKVDRTRRRLLELDEDMEEAQAEAETF